MSPNREHNRLCATIQPDAGLFIFIYILSASADTTSRSVARGASEAIALPLKWEKRNAHHILAPTPKSTPWDTPMGRNIFSSIIFYSKNLLFFENNGTLLRT